MERLCGRAASSSCSYSIQALRICRALASNHRCDRSSPPPTTHALIEDEEENEDEDAVRRCVGFGAVWLRAAVRGVGVRGGGGRWIALASPARTGQDRDVRCAAQRF